MFNWFLFGRQREQKIREINRTIFNADELKHLQLLALFAAVCVWPPRVRVSKRPLWMIAKFQLNPKNSVDLGHPLVVARCTEAMRVWLSSPAIAATHRTFHFLRFGSWASVSNRFVALFHGPNDGDIHVYHHHDVAPKSNAKRYEIERIMRNGHQWNENGEKRAYHLVTFKPCNASGSGT